jgi:hypothetical protein
LQLTAKIVGIHPAATTGTECTRSTIMRISHAYLDLVARGGKAILCSHLRSDFEHAGDKLLKGGRLGG